MVQTWAETQACQWPAARLPVKARLNGKFHHPEQIRELNSIKFFSAQNS
jgi:hypothetical protein